jgi:hypothetical protein
MSISVEMDGLIQSVRDCFVEGGIQQSWIDNGKLYLAITEGIDWWRNKCILRNNFFDYKKFGKLGLNIDCESYGVYVVSK